MAKYRRQHESLSVLPDVPGKLTVLLESSPVVLIVEDDAALRTLMASLFESEGYVAVTASDGLEALEALQGQRPAIMLVDMMMPRMDGPEFVIAAAAHAAAVGAYIPVIMLSAAPSLARTATDLGVDYLCKPFDVEELLDKVQHHCQHRMAGAPA